MVKIHEMLQINEKEKIIQIFFKRKVSPQVCLYL